MLKAEQDPASNANVLETTLGDSVKLVMGCIAKFSIYSVNVIATIA